MRKKNQILPRQKKFVERFLIYRNAARAARESGYRQKSNVAGAVLMKNPRIQEEINRRIKDYELEFHTSICRLQRIAESSIEDFVDFTSDGKLFFNYQKAEEYGNLDMISKIRFFKDGSVRSIALQDADKALYKVAKLLNML
jgi:hypothetical protein